ncbi:MAG: hypothetical protein HQM03_17655 [Magnetococcales bacterium]|nr:hypothetical protein [Magnetococcales bacterium]
MPIRFMECLPINEDAAPNPWRATLPAPTWHDRAAPAKRQSGGQPIPPPGMARFQTRRERGPETACPPSTP